MNNSLQTNILLIGKTGVGKSSLLNYLFGGKRVKTGAGKPVTAKNLFHSEQIVLEGNLVINITDTWGLEADKGEEWKEMIYKEVKSHDKCIDIKDWYHTIIYCLSAKSARIEDFEIEIMKSLIRSGNNIVIALTHCDTNNSAGAINAIAKILIQEVLIEKKNIIMVSSVSKKLLGGRVTKTFGREEILNSIKTNLWQNICYKLYYRLKNIVYNELDNWYEASSSIIDKNIKWHNFVFLDATKKLKNEIDKSIKNTISIIEDEINLNIEQSYNYYILLNNKYSLISNLPPNKFINIKMNDKILKFDILNKNLRLSLIMNLITFNIASFLNFYVSYIKVLKLKKELKDKLKLVQKDMTNNILLDIKKYLDNIRKT